MAKSTKKAAPKKKAAAKKPAARKAAPKKKGLYGYSLQQRKAVPIKNAVVAKKGNRFIASGEDSKGYPIRAFVGREQATQAVGSGLAKKAGRW